MTEDTNALPMGFSLHRYLVESVLGAGGFGITYRGFDLKQIRKALDS